MLLLASLAFLLLLMVFCFVMLFDLEHRDDIFFRNVGLFPNYTVFQSRRPYFS
jgi:hypothetical protein